MWTFCRRRKTKTTTTLTTRTLCGEEPQAAASHSSHRVVVVLAKKPRPSPRPCERLCDLDNSFSVPPSVWIGLLDPLSRYINNSSPSTTKAWEATRQRYRDEMQEEDYFDVTPFFIFFYSKSWYGMVLYPTILHYLSRRLRPATSQVRPRR